LSRTRIGKIEIVLERRGKYRECIKNGEKEKQEKQKKIHKRKKLIKGVKEEKVKERRKGS